MSSAIPSGAATTTVEVCIPFSDIDGMGIVHHANYACYLERGRVAWLEEHDQPYKDYIAQGKNFAVTNLEIHYHSPARFADTVRVTTWLQWVRGASLRIAYALFCEDRLLITGATEHVLVDGDGRPRRIPKERREKIAGFAIEAPPSN